MKVALGLRQPLTGQPDLVTPTRELAPGMLRNAKVKPADPEIAHRGCDQSHGLHHHPPHGEHADSSQHQQRANEREYAGRGQFTPGFDLFRSRVLKMKDGADVPDLPAGVTAHAVGVDAIRLVDVEDRLPANKRGTFAGRDPGESVAAQPLLLLRPATHRCERAIAHQQIHRDDAPVAGRAFQQLLEQLHVPLFEGVGHAEVGSREDRERVFLGQLLQVAGVGLVLQDKAADQYQQQRAKEHSGDLRAEWEPIH